jgi:hypothetical protein
MAVAQERITGSSGAPKLQAAAPGTVTRRPEVIDDFIRWEEACGAKGLDTGMQPIAAASRKTCTRGMERALRVQQPYKRSGPANAPACNQAAARHPCLLHGPRNFCVKAGLMRTAEAFEAEWYELKATGRLGGLATSMPDVYLRNGVSATCVRLEALGERSELEQTHPVQVQLGNKCGSLQTHGGAAC